VVEEAVHRWRELEGEIVHSARSRSMSRHQMSLLEHALKQVSNIDQVGWDEIPPDLHPSFAKYMGAEVWTGVPDLETLREAALMIIRDAIARTGEFSNEEPAPVPAAQDL
jgi:hypothetical protein